MAAGEDRTESATPRRRSEARKRGQVARSTELASTAVMLGLLFALHGLLGGSASVVAAYFAATVRRSAAPVLTPYSLYPLAAGALLALARVMGPLVGLAIALAAAANMAQTGPLLATERLKPDFNRLNPLAGAARFFSPPGLVELVKSFYKIGLVGAICYFTVHGAFPELQTLPRMAVQDAVADVMEMAYQMAMRVLVAMLALSALDYAFQRFNTEKSLRMTREEVKQELRQTEGNPQMRARIRARQRQMARNRMIAAVPDADVVVTNPTHFAVALKYKAKQMAAPTVVAKGQDLIALKIRDVAKEHNVPVVENPPLARTLFKQGQLGKEIPVELYQAVAEVLAFVYRLNAAKGGGRGLGAAVGRPGRGAAG